MCAKKLTPDELPAELPAGEPDPYIDTAPVVAPPAEPPMMEIPVLLRGLSIGRIVHYVLTLGHDAGGSTRAAIITKVVDPAGTADLVWFVTRDDHKLQNYDTWAVMGAPFDPTGTPGTWHWPEQV